MRLSIFIPVILLAACDDMWLETPVATPVSAPVVEAPVVPTLNPTPPPPPPPSARTMEQFDTTTAADRAAAVAAPVEPAGEQKLGTTNVSLGPPAEPGIWLKTGLVKELTEGRVEYPANGKTITLELRPSGGDAGAGSQMSLAAMRLLDIPLTALADVVVYAK